MLIDNAMIVGLSLASLPANVSILTWDGLIGELEYSDAPAVRTLFVDPSPYLPMVNAWIVAAASAISLAQSKTIKSALVNQLYDLKRQAEYSGYEATDEAVLGMIEALSGPGYGSIGSFTSDYNNAAQTHANGVNSAFSLHLAYLNQSYGSVPDRINPSYSNFYSQFPAALHGQRFSPYDGPTITGGFTSAWPGMSMPAYPTLSTPADSTVQWFAIGATSPTSMAYSTFVSITSGIVSRRSSLQATRVTKMNQIAALSTIAAVAAYDVTAGW